MDPSQSTNDHEFKGKYGRELGQKKGKTFFKGRNKQIANDKNPSQWSAYNRAPRVKRLVNHHSPLTRQLSKTRETGNLSTKSLPEISDDQFNQNAEDDDDEKDKILKLSKEQIDDNKDDEKSDAAIMKKNKSAAKVHKLAKIKKVSNCFKLIRKIFHCMIFWAMMTRKK